MEKLESRIQTLIQQLKPALSGHVEELSELVETHGEYGVALENLCSLLEEKEIQIEKEQLTEILMLFKKMGFEQDSIEYYSKSLKTD
jgi:hypothetical protein